MEHLVNHFPHGFRFPDKLDIANIELCRFPQTDAMRLEQFQSTFRIRPVEFEQGERTFSTCLAPLERSSSGDFGYETGGALGAGGG
jgi:hypothetical protein